MNKKRLKNGWKNVSTRFWVHAAPKSWSKYTTNTNFSIQVTKITHYLKPFLVCLSSHASVMAKLKDVITKQLFTICILGASGNAWQRVVAVRLPLPFPIVFTGVTTGGCPTWSSQKTPPPSEFLLQTKFLAVEYNVNHNQCMILMHVFRAPGYGPNPNNNP